MNKSTLVIMAAGLGSRFGGIKQLEPVGPSGEIIMDYSIYAAIKAGFKKVVFIIRKDLEKDFKEVIGERIEKHIEVEYVFQDIDDLPKGYTKPEGRTKPWGTGHAILSCLGTIKDPFVVINADDYYGDEAFEKVYEFLNESHATTKEYHFCMVGFQLGNTLSEHGTVTRGVCKVSDDDKLVDIIETSGIHKEGDHIDSDLKDTNPIQLKMETPVSMNMWGFTPDFMNELNHRFLNFLDHLKENELKEEYLLPKIVDDLIKEDKAEVSVLYSKDKWFGVTYKEDKQIVVDSINQLVAKGHYPAKLFD